MANRNDKDTPMAKALRIGASHIPGMLGLVDAYRMLVATQNTHTQIPDLGIVALENEASLRELAMAYVCGSRTLNNFRTVPAFRSQVINAFVRKHKFSVYRDSHFLPEINNRHFTFATTAELYRTLPDSREWFNAVMHSSPMLFSIDDEKAETADVFVGAHVRGFSPRSLENLRDKCNSEGYVLSPEYEIFRGEYSERSERWKFFVRARVNNVNRQIAREPLGAIDVLAYHEAPGMFTAYPAAVESNHVSNWRNFVGPNEQRMVVKEDEGHNILSFHAKAMWEAFFVFMCDFCVEFGGMRGIAGVAADVLRDAERLAREDYERRTRR